jgi:DNA polymerase III alpha subunit (gram-positive type)
MVQYLESMGLDKAVAFTIAEKVRKGKGVDAKNADIMRKANIPD